MIFGDEEYGITELGHPSYEAVFGDSWIALCVTYDEWTTIAPGSSTVVDECRRVRPGFIEPPVFVPSGVSWAGVRIPSYPNDSSYAVVNATLKLQAKGNWIGFAEMEVYGVLQPDPIPFGAGAASVKSRPRTIAKTVWQSPEMTDGVVYSVDVTEQLIEILNQPTRNAGDAVAFVLAGIAGKREFEAGIVPDLEVVGA